MGGSGSGRYWWDKKTTVEDCLHLAARRLVKQRLLYLGIHTFGTLTWTKTATGEEISSCGYEINTLSEYASWLRLYYKLTRSGEELDYRIYPQTTRPHYGGVRWWFACPLVSNGRPCNRRVGKLYLPPGGRYYGCRHCYDLTYKSCQESHKFDALFASIARDVGTSPEMVKRTLENFS